MVKELPTLIQVKVGYESGLGGPHSEQGVYRVNPVTGEVRFSPWLGLGRPDTSRVSSEAVCSACGEQAQGMGDYGHCDCPDVRWHENGKSECIR